MGNREEKGTEFGKSVPKDGTLSIIDEEHTTRTQGAYLLQHRTTFPIYKRIKNPPPPLLRTVYLFLCLTVPTNSLCVITTNSIRLPPLITFRSFLSSLIH